MILKVGNMEAKKGEKKQGYLNIRNTELSIPCTLINGVNEGKTVAITGGTHGSEYPGIEAAIRLASELTPEMVSGKIIIVHPPNLPAFQAKLQYIGPYDGKNLNCEFPGLATGTITQKIAYTITTELHEQSDFYMDLHGGDIHEAQITFVIYPELGSEEVIRISKEAAEIFDMKYIVKTSATRSAVGSAALKGVPGLICEIGKSGIWTEEEVDQYIKSVKNVLKYLKVIDGKSEPLHKVEHIYGFIEWKAKQTGCWYPCVSPGQNVAKNEKIGEIKDYFGKTLEEYFSPIEGIILYTVTSLAINVDDIIGGLIS